MVLSVGAGQKYYKTLMFTNILAYLLPVTSNHLFSSKAFISQDRLLILSNKTRVATQSSSLYSKIRSLIVSSLPSTQR